MSANALLQGSDVVMSGEYTFRPLRMELLRDPWTQPTPQHSQ